MKQIKCLLFVAIAATFFSACNKVVGEGPVTTTDRMVTAFSAIDVSVPAEIHYYRGSESKVQIIAQQNITNLIENIVSGSTLHVQFDRNNVNIKSKGVRINITSPGLNGVHISGSANFYTSSVIEADEFQLSLSGSCNAEIDSVTTNILTSSISGSGRITMRQGSVQAAQVEISGSGNVDMVGVTVANVTINSSGSGTIRVTATDKLNVHISGSGRVYYKGSPDISTDISGSGGVSKIE